MSIFIMAFLISWACISHVLSDLCNIWVPILKKKWSKCRFYLAKLTPNNRIGVYFSSMHHITKNDKSTCPQSPILCVKILLFYCTLDHLQMSTRNNDQIKLSKCRFLPPANEVVGRYFFTPVCQSFCTQLGCA